MVTDLDGKIVEGNLKPSSDLDTHLEIYRNFPGVLGVVHTHSGYATAFAQAQAEIPVFRHDARGLLLRQRAAHRAADG